MLLTQGLYKILAQIDFGYACSVPTTYSLLLLQMIISYIKLQVKAITIIVAVLTAILPIHVEH